MGTIEKYSISIAVLSPSIRYFPSTERIVVKAKNPHKSLEPGLLISACEKLSPAQDKLTLTTPRLTLAGPQ